MSAGSRRSARGVERHLIIVTCEHGGNRIPVEYVDLFRGWQRVLRTHRGFDAGALLMARDLAAALDAPLVASTVSRLLIDLNRSLSNRQAWSAATRALPPAERQRLVRRHYAPYRRRVGALVAEGVAAGHRVLHLSSHSFTPILDGEVRNTDVGLLYDPARPGEVRFATRWKNAFAEQAPTLRVRRNYPYDGRNDGLTSLLRRRFSSRQYIGVETELNQALVSAGVPRWRDVRHVVITTLQAALR